MDRESEVIKQQMEETRSSLVEKLEALEDKVASTVQGTTEAVAGTVENVKEAVEETIETVSDSVEQVKEAFDLPKQVQEHPWLMMGGAVVAGYLGARLLERGLSEVSQEASRTASAAPQRTESTGGGWNRPSEPGLLDRLTESLTPALDKVKGLALGVTAGVVGRMILDSVPQELRGELEGVINEFTRSLGGTPMPGFLQPKENQNQNPALARASAPPPRP
jgi:ElaB/YqjD/DUF883 family membrane-anchored ribosome-binding protein